MNSGLKQSLPSNSKEYASHLASSDYDLAYPSVVGRASSSEPDSRHSASTSRDSISSLVKPQQSAPAPSIPTSNSNLSQHLGRTIRTDQRSQNFRSSAEPEPRHTEPYSNFSESQRPAASFNTNTEVGPNAFLEQKFSSMTLEPPSALHSSISNSSFTSAHTSLDRTPNKPRQQSFGRLSVLSANAELEECASETGESPNPGSGLASDLAWTSFGKGQSLDVGKTTSAPPSQNKNMFSNELRRSPQDVQLMTFNSGDGHHQTHSTQAPYQVQKIYQVECTSGASLNTDSFANDTVSSLDDDDEFAPPLLESLPTPQITSPSDSSTSRSSSQNNLTNMRQAQAPEHLLSGQRLQASANRLSHASGGSPVQGGLSPKLMGTRPRSSIGVRAANRQSYYDLGSLNPGKSSNMPSSSPINLNLADAAAANSGSSALIPRMKTIDLYRRNARKSNDPKLEFELAQFIMQTALMANAAREVGEQPKNSASGSPEFEQSTSSNSRVSSPSRTSRSESIDLVVSPNESQKSESNSSAQNSVFGESSTSDDAKIVANLFKDAVSSLKRLSERGYADAQYLLGDIYSSDAITNKPDPERSIKYFLMAAKHGHAEASYRAALCLQEGWGTNRDASRAIQLFKKAAILNQPGALYQLGMAYFYGGMGITDTSANRQAGVKWLSRAVNASDFTYNRAPHELAKIYEVGYKDLVIPDEGYAVKLFTHAASLRFVPSAARLGHAYEFGELGCPQDPTLSIHYYTIAALGNDPNAQLAMCAWYMAGAEPDFPVNHDEAFEWALRAALNGLPKAQYTVGFLYEQGTGCQRNVVEAAKWYKRAANGGHEKSKLKLQKLGISEDEKRKNKCIIM